MELRRRLWYDLIDEQAPTHIHGKQWQDRDDAMESLWNVEKYSQIIFTCIIHLSLLSPLSISLLTEWKSILQKCWNIFPSIYLKIEFFNILLWSLSATATFDDDWVFYMKRLFSLSPDFPQMSGLSKNPLAGLAALGLAGAIPSNTGGLNQTGITNCMKSQFSYEASHSKCRFHPDVEKIAFLANSITVLFSVTLWSSGCPRRLTIAHDTKSNADQHTATWNDCAKRFDRMHYRQRRNQNRWNPSNLWCHDSYLELRGARRRQHRSYNHHQWKSWRRCSCSIFDQYEVSERFCNMQISASTNTRSSVVINIINQLMERRSFNLSSGSSRAKLRCRREEIIEN